MQDPRLGGSSELVDLPKIDLDEMSNPKRVEEVQVDSAGNVSTKSTESFDVVLKREENMNLQLAENIETVTKVLKQCKAKLAAARISKGLPAEKYPAITRLNATGGITTIRAAEQTLDDAFRIKQQIEKEEQE